MFGIGLIVRGNNLVKAELGQKPEQIFPVDPAWFRLHAAAKGLFLLFQIGPLVELDQSSVPVAQFRIAEGMQARITGTHGIRIDNMRPEI